MISSNINVNQQVKETYFYNLDFLKVIAVLLIVNSHMEPIYPISSLATGGALGNSLFFIISGYLARDKRKDIKFFVQFILKLYIPLYIVTLISGFDNDKELFEQLIWPTNYWFIGAIVLFYFIYTLLEKISIFNNYYIFAIIMVLIYLIIYVFVLDTSIWIIETPGLNSLSSSFKLVYYFLIMVTGGFLRYKNFSVKEAKFARKGWIVSILLMYASKVAMGKIQFLMHIQFLSQLCTFIFAVCIMIASVDSVIIKKIEKNLSFVKVTRYVSSISLEIYLVQFIIINFVSRYSFPINVFLSVFLIFLFASLLKYLRVIIINEVVAVIGIFTKNRS